MDSYGDGNVYRGMVCKDPEIKTIEINKYNADVERLVEAAKELCAKLNFVHEHESYKAIWYLAHSHYGDYKGPKYEQEFNELKAALEPFKEVNKNG